MDGEWKKRLDWVTRLYDFWSAWILLIEWLLYQSETMVVARFLVSLASDFWNGDCYNAKSVKKRTGTHRRCLVKVRTKRSTT